MTRHNPEEPTHIQEALFEVVDKAVEAQEGDITAFEQPLSPEERDIKDINEELQAIDEEIAEIQTRLDAQDVTDNDLHRFDELSIKKKHYGYLLDATQEDRQNTDQ